MIRIRNRILKVEKYGKNKKSNIKGKKDKWKLKNKYQISLILNNIWYLCNEVIHVKATNEIQAYFHMAILCRGANTWNICTLITSYVQCLKGYADITGTILSYFPQRLTYGVPQCMQPYGQCSYILQQHP